jgi:hypothetical protein
MGRRFWPLIRHHGEGKRRDGTGRGSVGDVEARGGGGGGSAQHDGSPPDGRSGGGGPEEGDDLGGPSLGRKAIVAWANFRKFHGKSRRAVKATGPN